jgi:hypothetical protein
MTTKNNLIRAVAGLIQGAVAALFPPAQAPNLRPKLAPRNGYGSATKRTSAETRIDH